MTCGLIVWLTLVLFVLVFCIDGRLGCFRLVYFCLLFFALRFVRVLSVGFDCLFFLNLFMILVSACVSVLVCCTT